MKKFSQLTLAGAVLVLMALASCSKGSNGATGATGPAGPDSVYYSGWTTLDFTGSTDGNGDSLYGQSISCGNLTQGILDSGLIISYVGVLGTNEDYVDVEPTVNYDIFDDYEVGVISFFSYPTSDGGIGTEENSAVALRFVIIPGAVLTSTTAFQGMSKAQITTLSYEKMSTILAGTGSSAAAKALSTANN
jgi:hypothetical protein